MSHQLNISEALRRPIQNGSSFSAFIKETNCKAFSYGNGNNSTIEGVEYMADMVKKSSYQVKKLAEKLKKSTVQATVSSVHKFLTTYIQYDADAKLQKLRSPGCSWAVRQTGIDCKSFSIFAGALLREMGISFAIRQVKQPTFYPDQYTHVYVVVPTNQKINKLNKLTSYHNLDATVLDNKEVVFTAKKDKLMSGLPYQGMMAPGVSNTTSKETKEARNFERSFPQFEKLGFSRSDLQRMKEYMKELQAKSQGYSKVYMIPRPGGLLLTDAGSKGVVFKASRAQVWQGYFNKYSNQNGLNAVGTLTAVTGAAGMLKDLDVGGLFDDVFGSLDGLLGGLFGSDRGWYKPEFVKEDAGALLTLLKENTQKINQAVVSKNMGALGDAVADFRLNIKLFIKSAKFVKNRRSWNDPTIESMDQLIQGLEKLKQKAGGGLNSWLSQYFSVTGTKGSKTRSSQVYLDRFHNREGGSIFYPVSTASEPIPSLTIKSGVSQVKAFNVTGEGEIILRGLEPQQPTSPTYPTGGTSGGTNYNDGSDQTAQIDTGVKKASLIPGFSNTALIATGGVLVAGVLLYPTIKKSMK